MLNLRKKTLPLAMIAALAIPAGAEADTVTLSWSGAFTFMSANGGIVYNSDTNTCMPGMDVGFGCFRSALTGTLTFDTATGTGSGSVVPFSFLGAGNMVFPSLDLQTIGNGAGGSGSLVLGNMLMSWNGNIGMPASIVWDASGLQSAINNGLSVGQAITGGALSASDNSETDSNPTVGGTTYPIGPALMATTTWDTTTIPGTTFGTTPSGTLPLITDTVVDVTNGDIGIGGSAPPTAPLQGYNFTLDFLSAEVTNIEAVPIPAAIWLFGSGLAGLAGIARRKRGKPSTQAG